MKRKTCWCGAEVAEGADFCESCNKTIEEVEKEEDEKPKVNLTGCQKRVVFWGGYLLALLAFVILSINFVFVMWSVINGAIIGIASTIVLYVICKARNKAKQQKTDLSSVESELEQKPKKSKLPSVICAVVALVVVFFGTNAYLDSNHSRATFVARAVQRVYTQGNYSRVLDMIENFNLNNANHNRRATANVNRITESIDRKMYEEISNANNDEDIESAAARYLDRFPEGRYAEDVSRVLLEASTRLARERLDTARQRMNAREWGMAETILGRIISGHAPDSYKAQARGLVDVIRNTPATGFELISGSANVNITSARLFDVTCTHCGFVGRSMSVGGALGPAGLSGRTVGVETVTGGMMCASAFQGGCRQRYSYTLTVRFY